MRAATEDVLKDWLGLLFAGLGITFARHQWLGGMFLALAGASIARHIHPERDRRELWVVFLTAFVVSHLAAIIAHLWLPGWPVQLVMAISGFGSRRLARFASRFLDRIEARAGDVADRGLDRILPETRKNRDEDNAP